MVRKRLIDQVQRRRIGAKISKDPTEFKDKVIEANYPLVEDASKHIEVERHRRTLYTPAELEDEERRRYPWRSKASSSSWDPAARD